MSNKHPHPRYSTTNTENISTPPPSKRSHFLFADCQPVSGKIYTNQTGRFLTPSSAGNSYLLILYGHDSNSIHAEPMLSHNASKILAAYMHAHTLLTSRGLHPLLQTLDNEASHLLHTFMATEQIDYQLVPPHIHRRNAAERAIQTLKNHFIAGLCTTDPNKFSFASLGLLAPPSTHLHQPPPQLPHQSPLIRPRPSSRTPLAPPGTKVLVHKKTSVRGTWAPHTIDEWYLGPALNHYRCYRVWIWSTTTAKRIADSLAWFPT
jgi:hypothetical protein